MRKTSKATVTAAAQGGLEIQPNKFRDAGLRMARSIDSGQLAQIWDGASSVAKQIETRDAFVEGIAAGRDGFERPEVREWIAIHRQHGGGTLPPGEYVSVRFSAAFPGNRILRELISFRRDEDDVWRFVGYAIE